MANFTYEIKKDIISLSLPTKGEKRALLSAFFRTSASLSYDFLSKLFGFEVITESEECAEYILNLIEEEFSCSPTSTVNEDRLSGKNKFRFELKGEKAEELLFSLGFLKEEEGSKLLVSEIGEEYFLDSLLRKAFVSGAFLGSGSCTTPNSYAKTGYHLQFYLSGSTLADGLSEMLVEEDILPKKIEHNGSYVVYVNSKEAISDFLSYIGAQGALKQLDKIVDRRDASNKVNRINNCTAGNKARTASAAALQVQYITEIDSLIGIDSLREDLLVVARARMEYPEASLQELADLTRLTKSCVSRRMKKITEIYESLEK